MKEGYYELDNICNTDRFDSRTALSDVSWSVVVRLVLYQDKAGGTVRWGEELIILPLMISTASTAARREFPLLANSPINMEHFTES